MDGIYLKIKTLRNSKNISQTEMAQKLGMVQNNYSRLEKGDISITVERLLEIANILEEPIVNFFIEEPSTSNSNLTKEDMENIIEMDLAINEAIFQLNYKKTEEAILILRIVLGILKDFNISYYTISPTLTISISNRIHSDGTYKLLAEEILKMDESTEKSKISKILAGSQNIEIYSKKELLMRIKNKTK